MSDFNQHVDAMFHLVHDYCLRQGIADSISGLLIFRLLEPTTYRPLALALVGEPAPIALKTCHEAIDMLTSEALRSHVEQRRRIPSA